MKPAYINSLFVTKLLGLPRVAKRALALAIDLVICVASVLLAYYLRLGEWVIPVSYQWLSVFAAPVMAIPLFIRSGFYRAIFRYSGWSALAVVSRAGLIYGMAYGIIFTLVSIPGVPRTVGLIQPILLFGMIGASRASARFWLGGGYQGMFLKDNIHRVLIYGAGSSGRQLAAALKSSDEIRVVGFVDDDPTLHGSVLNGTRIYAPDRIADLVDDLGINDVLLAMPSASRRRRSEILELIRGKSVNVRTLPGMLDLAHGRVTTNDLRELDIEDLLGRDCVAPNEILLTKNIIGKTVLITGAGGSIGGELCRQIVRLRPKNMLLVDRNEYGLYTIHNELTKLADHENAPRIIPLLASVTDEARMLSILQTWKPHTLYHAAAYKHVPLVEHNPAEGIRNNVFGTLNTAKAAALAKVSDFVLISTDKAVRPTNIMGASKRLAEMTLQALSKETGIANKSTTKFTMVRFGNVLNSSGSVVPLFRSQIKSGGPVTITHEEVTRYFMTIPEAAQLVLQAGAMAQGGDVFLLDMGEPVKILDLARKMIELSGATVRDDANPQGDIEIKVVGLRPGEKLYEELLIGDNPAPTSHTLIMKAHEKFMPWAELEPALVSLADAIAKNDLSHVRRLLTDLVPEYVPEAASVDWVETENATVNVQ